MIRLFFLLFLSCFLCSGISAQDPPSTIQYKKQFGFDASVLINRFLNFSGSNPQSSPYQITYRKYGETSNKRYGLGFRIGLDIGDVEPTSQTSIQFRFGKERFKHFGKILPNNPGISRWRAFYGWDWISQLGIIHIGANDVTNFSMKFGPSPFFGLSFQINERLSISTEMAYDLGVTFSRISEQNTLRINGNFIPPVALYVGYDF